VTRCNKVISALSSVLPIGSATQQVSSPHDDSYSRIDWRCIFSRFTPSARCGSCYGPFRKNHIASVFRTAHAAARSPICASFDKYIATLPLCSLTSRRTSVPILQQSNVKILIASDGGHKDDYGSFGCVIGTKHEVMWDCEGMRDAIRCSPTELKGSAHYIRYYNIQPADDLCVTSYCVSIQVNANAQSTTHVNSGRNNLLSSFGRTAHTLERSVCSSTRTWDDFPDNSSARSRHAAQLRVETAYAHAPLMLSHDR
jgi:hypothetical protein